MNSPGLSRMEPFTDEHLLRVIVETPKGSRNKYDWQEDLGLFRMSKVLQEARK